MRQLVDGVGEVDFGVEAVQLRRLDQGVEDGGTIAARIGPEKQEVLAGDRDAAQQPLGQVVVNGEPAIVGVAGQRFPAAQGMRPRAYCSALPSTVLLAARRRCASIQVFSSSSSGRARPCRSA